MDISNQEIPDEFTYYSNKKRDRTYISKAFTSPYQNSEETPRKMRILSKVIDGEQGTQFAEIKKETLLRTTPSGRDEIKIIFYEDNRKIKNIIIQRFTKKSGKPHKISFSFSGKSIETLYNTINMIRYIELEGEDKVRLDDKTIDEWLVSDSEKKRYFLENFELIEEVIKNEITTSDVIAIGYRKEQLRIFNSLLTDKEYFESIKNTWGVRGDEGVWQRFFEENTWIFGYGLNFIFSTQLDDKKLEQITTGFNFNESGKRVDALMKTRGVISSLCFVEIKKHNTNLLQNNTYRPECWSISTELSGSIAQIQKTTQKAINQIQTKIEPKTTDGFLSGETIFLYQPKSYIVIGTLREFTNEYGVNEQKFSSFELFRRSITNPEIITFDELYERAKYIVELNEEEKSSKQVENSSSINNQFDEEEIPF